MKVCRKCNKEYKDDYSYCPKCGTPYDINAKPVKTKGNQYLWLYIVIGIVGVPIVLAILFLFFAFVIYMVTPSTKSDSDIKENEQTITDNTNEGNDLENNTEENTEEEKKIIYEIKYNVEGEFGKRQDYEGEKDVFYYIPSGTYKIKRISGKENICWLWLFYKESYQDVAGTEYNSKDKYRYESDNLEHEVTVTDDTMIYLSNDCNYTLEKQ